MGLLGFFLLFLDAKANSFTRMETTYGGKGKQADDGEADDDQRNEVSYLCARCGCGEHIMGFVGEFVGFTPLSVVLQLRQPCPPCT